VRTCSGADEPPVVSVFHWKSFSAEMPIDGRSPRVMPSKDIRPVGIRSEVDSSDVAWIKYPAVRVKLIPTVGPSLWHVRAASRTDFPRWSRVATAAVPELALLYPAASGSRRALSQPLSQLRLSCRFSARASDPEEAPSAQPSCSKRAPISCIHCSTAHVKKFKY
jgi:hypothetical protein